MAPTALLALRKVVYFDEMTFNAPKYVSPSISQTAFNCPHCGALAKQHWFELRAEVMKKDALPIRISGPINNDFLKTLEDDDEREKWRTWLNRMIQGAPFLKTRQNQYFGNWDVHMLDISQCYNCDQISIWVKSDLVYPLRGDAPLPNADMPEDVRLDFDEAGRIFRISPRGAAALLRLAIQKLCKHIGGDGDNINEDVALLVKNGLDVRIQQSLDIVRVIGNEAVHPGQLDLNDNIGAAEQLFSLINIITDAMISQPKQIEKIYAALPESKRAAIAQRDANKTPKS